jgi:hypothetical protein
MVKEDYTQLEQEQVRIVKQRCAEEVKGSKDEVVKLQKELDELNMVIKNLGNNLSKGIFRFFIVYVIIVRTSTFL